MSFARAWDAPGIVVVNLFALRATDPRELLKADDPVGRENDWHLLVQSDPHKCSRVIAAWGAMGGLRGRAGEVFYQLRDRRLECLGVTNGGQPRHPLYVRRNVELAPFQGASHAQA